MNTKSGFVLAAVAAASIGWTVNAVEQRIPVSCRHHRNPRPSDVDKARRAGAEVLARAINAAQMDSLRRNRKYEPAENLRNLPPTPDGFKLNLYMSDSGYLFSIKDTLDPCSFAVFSDASQLLYQQSGRSAPVIASE
jgi:hypothetical protein